MFQDEYLNTNLDLFCGFFSRSYFCIDLQEKVKKKMFSIIKKCIKENF